VAGVTGAQSRIVRACEDYLARHGDSHLGVGWPHAGDASRRYEVMLDVIRAGGARPVTLLDFGCGAGHLYDHLLAAGRTDIAYAGHDLSPAFRRLMAEKHPDVSVYAADVLSGEVLPPRHDYVVANGVFTMKMDIPFEDMWEYFTAMLVVLASLARVGFAFNVMSSHVDWERDDLFHVPHDRLADFLIARFGRSFVMRSDYGLYEYTTYVYP
jgi:SAM-dependent methyltransferase